MFKNYFKAAWRNITRNKSVTFISLISLSVALVAFIFITLWVHNELNFDNYHKDAKSIYLVQVKSDSDNGVGGVTPFPLADAIKKQRNVEYVARMAWWGGVLNINGELFNQNEGVAVDDDWFNIFHYDVISGNLNAFGKNKFSLIFTESKAKQLFGNKNPIGELVKLDTTLYQVSAVVKDNPINSSLRFEMFVPMAARMNYRKGDFNNWYNNSYRTFVKVYENNHIAAFEKNITTQSLKASGGTGYSFVLQPLRELHFDTLSEDHFFRRGSRTAIFVFSVLAVLLLITASINYINLTIAKANTRSKEISVRRIVGGSRTQLFFQFLAESLLLCLLSMFVSMVIMKLTLPAFNNLTEAQFELSVTSKILWQVLLATLIFTTLLNGVFPALTMSYFKPLNYLQGHTILKLKNILLRKGLVVFQFVIGVVFIIGAIVIFLQMKLAQTSAAQYNRSQVVSFRLPNEVFTKMNDDEKKISLFCQSVKNDLQRNSYIQSVALANNSIEGGLNSSGVGNWYWKGIDTALKASISYVVVEPGTKNIFNLQLKEGRWFNEDNSDKKNYILNETAVAELGIKQPVIGQVFARSGADTGQIIGVVKDYAFSSLYNKITPLVIGDNDSEWKVQYFIKIAPGNIPQAMEAITATWKKFIKETPLEYKFMNESFDNLYKSDLKISKLMIIFSCITVIISILGLFSLATFIAERRKKEIGIRKVFGASVAQITTMLSKDFILMVILAIVIASPIALWAMNKWLQNFVYRIDIGWWIFLSAGAVAILIAIITVCFQTIKAAMANPVKSLRTE